ncbi:MAG: SDR family oxidoreductase [Chromatiales bacterium]|jgi:NAD(P)-dependent dehydrogenase (short-subunit alcohol dehydrogenase family)|nr:SDR family oxidoreductase [Chromatiales bacterium]
MSLRRLLIRSLAFVLAAAPALVTSPVAAAPGPGEPGYIPTVIVTGANRGIGLALAEQYLARGYRVIATARKPAEATALNTLAAASKGLFIVEPLDVIDLDAIDALAAKYKDLPIDVVMNNAGVTGGGQNQVFGRNMQYELFDEVFRVNAVAPLKMAEAFLPHLQAGQQKKFTIVSSSQGSIGGTKQAGLYIYRSSKAAANMIGKNLSLQLKGKGIAVAMINPGPVDTDMMKGLPKSFLRATEDAARDLIQITDAANLENTGTFWDFTGTVLPW